ncbi:CHRD domain-containing protein [Leptospira ellisii]|uniref:CHRD domain-containing protein n=1 Tax=Leptospira ellisii TaxID=2023197 RepID=A0AAE4U269_9LEPT|nr:CHRD domain-containing protein [Leptospira ellisii]MDV6237141.1 CHRD domain-containing protein [Leptospira ellisii]
MSLKDAAQKNVNARGSVDAILDDETSKLKIAGSYEYFGSNATEILVLAEGSETPLCSLKPPYNATNSPWKDWGACDLNVNQKKELNSGKLYILIKTIERPEGQVRGPILPESKK